MSNFALLSKLRHGYQPYRFGELRLPRFALSHSDWICSFTQRLAREKASEKQRRVKRPTRKRSMHSDLPALCEANRQGQKDAIEPQEVEAPVVVPEIVSEKPAQEKPSSPEVRAEMGIGQVSVESLKEADSAEYKCPPEETGQIGRILGISCFLAHARMSKKRAKTPEY